ncbi:hypothetical protein ACWEQL_16430 [Kitasatospora sp. NPDC004240]
MAVAAVLALGLLPGCGAGEEAVEAVSDTAVTAQFAAAGGGERSLTAPPGVDWDTAYVFDTLTGSGRISEVVGDPVEWRRQDPDRSAPQLLVLVLKGEVAGAYEIGSVFADGDRGRPLHREVRFTRAAPAAPVTIVGQ